MEDNNAQGAPARGLVRVAMDEDNVKVQGAPARGLVRVRTCIEDSVSVQEAPARGLVKVGSGNHHRYREVRRVTEETKIGMQRVTDVTAARFLFIKEGIEATEVTKVRCLGGHMCDRNQPLTEETKATDVVIMGAPGDVSMVRRFSEVDQLILLNPELHRNASRAVRDS
ncbi:hypothetical protein PoB_006760400 [Plakobranchus ocellatus]|uniref:Uncharacterized protein n=1 Tax=Plakobranchus ocellatus TaxID=259542 RepID=A0AAV4DAD0_9GAST|nr:hypothetical protein PoB_006760400 [Plakobranchus ocellatus]